MLPLPATNSSTLAPIAPYVPLPVYTKLTPFCLPIIIDQLRWGHCASYIRLDSLLQREAPRVKHLCSRRLFYPYSCRPTSGSRARQLHTAEMQDLQTRSRFRKPVKPLTTFYYRSLYENSIAFGYQTMAFFASEVSAARSGTSL